jgi:uncharacterized protein (TIGR03067 family)
MQHVSLTRQPGDWDALESEHPSGDLLTAYGLGQLREEALAEIDRHLAGCGVCREVVEGVAPDTLVSLLRSAATEPDSTDVVAEVLRSPGSDTQGFIPQPRPRESATPPPALADHPRYRVGELLGVGGMGAVYKAEHLLMERPVALKVLNRELLDRPATVERFRREVRAAAWLTHPNIVAAFDAEQAGDLHFLAMEYVEGVSLARHIAESGPLPVAEACNYVRQAALGLQHAHERGMVHRDIKPQNLMLTPAGQVKILDFGLARFVMESVPAGALLTEEGSPAVARTLLSGPDSAKTGQECPVHTEESPPDEAKRLTQTGIVMGTPDYIAPEQARDSHLADIRADIYSLGCTLYDLLAGQAPFPEGSAVQKVRAHLGRTPKPLTNFRHDLPPELVKVMDRMMAKDPAQRFETPAEVAAALTPFLTISKPPRRKKWLALSAGAACFAALLAGVIIYVQTDKGTIIIDTKDDKIKVQIEKAGGVKIIDEANKREYRLRPGEQDLPTGQYNIEVTEALGDLDFHTKRFELKRGKEVRLTGSFAADGEKKVVERRLSAAERQRAQERLDTLKNIASLKETMYQSGTVNIGEVLEAKRDVAKAELDLAPSNSDRVKSHEQIVALLRQLMNVREVQEQSGKALHVDVLKAKADLLEAQNDLDRAKAKATTQGSVVPEEAPGEAGPLFGGKPARFWLTQLNDTNPKFRAEAVEALGSLARKNTGLIPALVPFLDDRAYSVASAAANALGSLGPNAFPALLEVLREKKSPRAVRYAALALGKMGQKARPAVPLLSQALKSEKMSGWRAEIMDALGQIGPEAKTAVPAMIEALGEYLNSADLAKAGQQPNANLGLFGENSLPGRFGMALSQIEPETQGVLPKNTGSRSDKFDEDKALWQKAYEELRRRYSSGTGDGAQGTPSTDPEQELARFQGTWSVAKQQLRWEMQYPTHKYIFSGNTITAMAGKNVLSVSTFKIDPRQNPKAIDLRGPSEGGKEGHLSLGIYEFEGDTLKICLRLRGDKKQNERPTSFADLEKNLAIEFLKKDQDEALTK